MIYIKYFEYKLLAFLLIRNNVNILILLTDRTNSLDFYIKYITIDIFILLFRISK